MQANDVFINAVLADAAYVDGLLQKMSDIVLKDKLKDRLTEPLAKYVGDNFTVASQYTDPGSSGFSVTVFRDNAGQTHVSMRGTDAWTVDFLTDADAYLGSGNRDLTPISL